MATYLDGNPWGNIAWNGDSYKSGDKYRDKYFEKDGKGNYKLKDGYETRYLGSGEKTSRNGAVATYTNSFDDMHDDYDPNNDRKNYGIYEVKKPQTVTKTVYKDKPVAAPPKPAEKRMEAGSFKVSPEIQQAKDRVNAYEGNKSSAWDQSQATVQSSFIKPPSSSSSNQYDFSADSFEAKESPEPAEKAHAAQDQMQNYISKYSKDKSSN